MNKSVFVSKPNSLSTSQTQFCDELYALLKARGLSPRTLGQTDFPNEAPINAVRTVLTECSGVIVLGLKQTLIRDGLHKADTADEAPLRDCFLPTAWNHIEAGMGFMLRLPMLIVKEPGVRSGIFDAGSTDKFIHQADLSNGYLSSERFLQPFNAWYSEVLVHPTQQGH